VSTNARAANDDLPTNRAEALKVLGDDTRRLIVERLAEGPMPVGVLARGLPVSRSAVSQHLKVLKDAHLVVDRAEGTRRVYQLDHAGLDLLRSYLDLLWARALESFQTAAGDPASAPARPAGSRSRRKELR
jgi:DNA-binding transcriptional ArsR family regulator